MKYDCVIVSRFDVTFDESPNIVPTKNEVHIPIGPSEESVEYVLGGLPDFFAFGDFASMNVYCTLFNDILRYHHEGHGLHPESILRKHLEFNNVPFTRFPTKIRLRNRLIV
jgi:hypothetical protein